VPRQPGTAFWAHGLLPVEQGAGRFDRRQLGLELLNGAACLGQLVDLDVLGALLEVGIDEGLLPPPMKGRLGDASLTRDFADPFAGDQAFADVASKLSRIAFRQGLPPGRSRPNSYKQLHCSPNGIRTSVATLRERSDSSTAFGPVAFTQFR